MKVFCVLLVVGMLVYAECNSIAQQDADEIDEKSAAIAAELLPAVVDAAELFYDIQKDVINFLWGLPATVAKPYMYMINFELDGNGVWQSGELQDGDRIKISRKPKSPNSSKNQVKFTLRQPYNTWWKAVTVHTPGNKFKYEIVACQDSRHEHTNNVEYREILENYLVLSKAKTFGIHTNVYWIQNSYTMTPNYSWDIEWQKD